jgi:stage V sporulation protein B
MPAEQTEETTITRIHSGQEVTLGTKIVRSAAFGGLRYVLLIPVPFVMTPLILRKVGSAGYGTWVVFLALNSMTSVADMGLIGTVTKFVAEYYASRNFNALGRVLDSALALFLLLGLAIGGLVAGAIPVLIPLLFRGSSVPHSELIFLLRCFAVVIVANILMLLLSSVTSGLQRLDLTHVMSAANILLSATGAAILLLRGWGLRGLVYAYVFSALLILAGYVVIVRRLLPEVSINPLRFRIDEAKKMFSFSLQLYVTQAAVAVHNQVEKLFLAMLVGVSAAGWYDIAGDVALKVRGAIGFVLSPVLPAASELSALGDELRMRELYYRTHKYLALFGIPAVCYVVAISHRFVELWLGSSLRIIALPLSVLALVNFFNLVTGPGFCIFAGSGYLKPGIQSALLGIFLNVFLSFGLIYKFGFAGAVAGTSASLILSSIYFISIFHHRTRYSFGRLLRESYMKPTICSLLVLAALFTVVRPNDLSWFGLAALGLAFGTLYCAVILLSRFFDEYDWRKIEIVVPLVRHVRRTG